MNDENLTAERLADEGTALDRDELAEAEGRLRLKPAVVYEVIRRDGEEELTRSIRALSWSGLAAGLSIGFSVVAEGLFKAYLPDTTWTPLVDNLGYSVGFLIVILARQQLFTENTISAVLPVVASPSAKTIGAMARLWSIVFAANMVGTLIFAAMLSSDLFFPPEPQEAFREISRHLMNLSPQEAVLRGIIAGWIIATLVWLLPSVGGAAVLVIIIMTWLIAAADLAHVIAGSVEAFLLAFDGEIPWFTAIFGFVVPALIGNIIGGSALFALIAYAQVREEI